MIDVDYNSALTPKIPRGQIWKTSLFFSFNNTAKQMISFESTVEEISFKWSHHTISETA